jgi:hypothetical protein
LCEEIRAKYAPGRGREAGTNARVKALHNLIKSGKTRRQAQAQVKREFGKGVDLRTYYTNCKEATGESPSIPHPKSDVIVMANLHHYISIKK